jgi:signal transduction histidine kinase
VEGALKPRLAAIFVLIVILPLAVLGWLGAKVARDEQEMVRHRFREVLLSRLDDIDGDVAGVLAARERELMAAVGAPVPPCDVLREEARGSGVVNQFFVLDPAGDLVHPHPADSLSQAEAAFLERTASIWQNREIPPPSPEFQLMNAFVPQSQQQVSVMGKGAPTQQSVSRKGSVPMPTHRGWYAWHWGNGINLIFWWRNGEGSIVGAELNRVRLTADIVGALPETDPDEPALPDGRIRLMDERETVLYQWGGYVPGDDESPRVTSALSYPLASWQLEYYAPARAMGGDFGRSVWFNVGSALGVLALALVAMAIYFYREYAREMWEAARRVSFVNQVSHELKTPLTNIRMYAEMMEDDLDDTDERSRHHLSVIVSESQRLSRLIGNVLTFSRQQRSALRFRPTPGNVDDVLRAAAGRFEAALGANGVAVVFHGAAGGEAMFDPDILEQILGNLLSNVEKYAASGGRVEITTRQEGDTVAVTVADQGPGIPRGERERIFRPFHRLSDKLTEGVAGTGIGLAIARDLARLHGGDLVLVPAERGACFKLTAHAARIDSGGA